MSSPEDAGVSPRSGLPPPAEHRWKPGQSGNPRGRPKQSITALVREVLARSEFVTYDKAGQPQVNRLPEGVTVADLVAEVIVRQALKGDYPFMKELLERTEGKVPARPAPKGFRLADLVAEAEAAAAEFRPAGRPAGKPEPESES